MAKTKSKPEVTKRKVTMMSTMATGQVDKDGNPEIAIHKAEDYVREDFLDAYVTDARTRWQSVTVSDEYDAGPGGYDGQTVVPPTLDHELAGETFFGKAN